MDVSNPAAALASGLTMPVLRTLARRSSATTAAQVYRAAGIGTEAGVRRALERLAMHGVVTAELAGDRTLYSLNDEHILHKAVSALLRSDEELLRLLRKEISEWDIEPESSALFGSAARRDGDAESDIDVVLIRPPLSDAQQRETWAGQVRQLRERVRRWTGNDCQVIDRSTVELRRLIRNKEALVDTWRDEAVDLGGGVLIGELVTRLAD